VSAPTDRELLELTAKAAGVVGEYHDFVGIYVSPDRTPDNNAYWNPLTNDGDALRLAVKLRLFIEFDSAHTLVNVQERLQPLVPDEYAATRRAIVRVAAEIGKGLLTHDEFVLMFPGRFEQDDVDRVKAASETGSKP
jgi:hypothetical protein